MCVRLRFLRKRDTCLNVGIGPETTTADFYVMDASVLNTFSKEEALRYASLGTYKIKNIMSIPLVNINEVIRKHYDEIPGFCVSRC